jgi:dipeptidyl aminopeptidase/acylaminoacyl peptidase
MTVACAALLGSEANAADVKQAAVEPAKPVAAEPLTLKAFLAPPTLSMPKLSPSGRSIAIVRRVGELDQLLRIDLPDFKTTLLYQTHPLSKLLVDQKFREQISFVDWKSNDKLVISVDIPVVLTEVGTITAPVHMILNADGSAAPVYLNAAVKAGKARVDLSWMQDLLKDDPDHVMIGVRRDLNTIQLDRVDIKDASRTLLETGDDSVIAYSTDRKGDILTRTLEHDDGSLTLQGRAVGQTKWTKIFDFRRKQQRELAKYDWLGLGEEGTLYIAAKPETSAEGDTKVVRTYDLKTQTLGPVVWSNPTYDVESIVQEEESQRFLAGCYWVDTLQCEFKSPKLTANLKGLNKFFDGKRSLFIVSQSDDDAQWILLVTGPDEPGSYYSYDVKAHDLQQLGSIYPELAAERLGQMRRFEFKARDGAPLFAYVTEPPGGPKGPLPLVVMPHGGPEARDHFAFDQWDQLLATQGYVVLQPNFRGSDGFGRKFAEAGYGEWGGRMHDDVMDATRALIAEGRVDPKRICVVGGSYGGFEALYAAAVEPSTFRCAVSIDGVSDPSRALKSASDRRIRGADIVFQVRRPCRCRDGQHHRAALQHPGQRDLAGRGVGLVDDGVQRRPGLGQVAGRQREPGDEADAVGLAIGQHRLAAGRPDCSGSAPWRRERPWRAASISSTLTSLRPAWA